MKVGRKPKYDEWLTESGLLRIEQWAREGASDENIARNMGVALSTYYDWQNKFPELSEAIKKGKAPVDAKVENKLLDMALGYTVKVIEPIKLKTRKQIAGRGTIEEERVEYAEREIYIKPDVAAQIYWLKNRKPERWRDKPESASDPDALKQAKEILGGIECAID